nr:Dil domain-containing protein [Ipomoea batatas]
MAHGHIDSSTTILDVYGMVIANISKVLPNDDDAPPGCVDDMTKLFYLHEPGVLQNLAMINKGKSNSILVSGGSGAGKTKTAKMLMRNHAYLGGRSGVKRTDYRTTNFRS